MLTNVPTIFQEMDTPILLTADTTIPKSSSDVLEVVSSLASITSAVLVYSGIGANIGIYENDALRVIIPQGWADYLGVRLSALSSVGVRNMADEDITDENGILIIQFGN